MSNPFASREVCDMNILDFQTKKPVLHMDYANTNATELTGETVFAYGGKGHPKKVPFTGEKGGTFTIETQLATMQLYSLITGGAIETAAKFLKREVIKCTTAGEISVTGTPIAGSLTVFTEADDCGTAIACELASKKFTATTASSIAANSYAVAYYLEEITTGVQKISVKNTTFPKAVIIYADTYEKNENDEVIPYKQVVYKAQPQSQMTISHSNSGDPVSLTITFDLMADADGNMIDLIIEEA